MTTGLQIAQENVQHLLDILHGNIDQNGQSFVFDQDNVLSMLPSFIRSLESKIPLTAPYETPQWTRQQWALSAYVNFLYRLLYAFQRMPESIRSLIVFEYDFYHPFSYTLYIAKSRWDWVSEDSEFDIPRLTENDLVDTKCFSLVQSMPYDKTRAYILRLALS